MAVLPVVFDTTETVGGSKVVIYATNVGTNLDIHGAYYDGDGNYYVAAWDQFGYYNDENKPSKLDLIRTLYRDTTSPEVA